MIGFWEENWSEIFLIFVGTFALVTYLLQEHRKKIDAASLIILQIDEVQERLREISTYIVDGKLNETAFYESLPLIEEDYWSKYKHYFVRDMDAVSYASLNQLYNYISGVQEQQMLMKNLQKNNFNMTQTLLASIETQLISHNMFAQQIVGQNFDTNQIIGVLAQQREQLKTIINQGVLIQYIPEQIRISLEKILKEYSMLEIVGTDGYQLLKKISKKKF